MEKEMDKDLLDLLKKIIKYQYIYSMTALGVSIVCIVGGIVLFLLGISGSIFGRITSIVSLNNPNSLNSLNNPDKMIISSYNSIRIFPTYVVNVTLARCKRENN